MERVAWETARTESANGDVTVLTTPVPGRGETWIEDGITVRTTTGTPAGRYSFAWWWATARFSAAREFGTVISASSGAASMVHFQRGPRYVFHAHGTSKGELQNALRLREGRWYLRALRSAYWMMIDQLSFSRFDEVVAVSDKVERALRERPYRHVWKRTPLYVVPNTVDEAFFAPDKENRVSQRARLGLPDDSVAVSVVSRLTRQKGVDLALAAVALCSRTTHLLIGGEGEEGDALRSQAAKIDSADARVHFLGRLGYDEVRDTLHASDVFVFPVRNFQREGFPLTVIEALAAGLPVIVPKASTWPASVADRVHYVDVEDPAALAQAIRDFSARRSSDEAEETG